MRSEVQVLCPRLFDSVLITFAPHSESATLTEEDLMNGESKSPEFTEGHIHFCPCSLYTSLETPKITSTLVVVAMLKKEFHVIMLDKVLNLPDETKILSLSMKKYIQHYWKHEGEKNKLKAGEGRKKKTS